MGIDGPRGGKGARAHIPALACACCAVFFSFGASADLTVPAGGTESLAAGAMDLSCTDVVVAGTLNVNTGSLRNVRNFTIQPGGVVNGGSGLIELGGFWTNNGSFVAGSSTVNFRDLCAVASAGVSGSTTFFAASFVSGTGKNYVFAVGSTQTITSLLQITGTQANPIQFRSSSPGQVGFINLLNSGTQQIQHVGVTDVWATGQWLAPFLTNEGGGGNANRWFGTPNGGGGKSAAAIPTLDHCTLAVLIALLGAAGAWITRRRTKPRAASEKS